MLLLIDYLPFPQGEFRVNAHFLKQIYLSILRKLWKQLASLGDMAEVKYQGV